MQLAKELPIVEICERRIYVSDWYQLGLRKHIGHRRKKRLREVVVERE